MLKLRCKDCRYIFQSDKVVCCTSCGSEYVSLQAGRSKRRRKAKKPTVKIKLNPPKKRKKNKKRVKRAAKKPLDRPKKKKRVKVDRSAIDKQKKLLKKYATMKVAYKHYRKTKHWKRLRLRKRKLNPCCEMCESKGKLQVHHLDYRHWFDVELSDLMTLCRNCHKRVHGLNSKAECEQLDAEYQAICKI